MSFGGYYSNPLFSRSYSFLPQGSMTALVTRDTVATNSYAGNNPSYPPVDILPLEENEAVERVTELVPQSYLPPQTPTLAEQPVEAAQPAEPEPNQQPVESVPPFKPGTESLPSAASIELEAPEEQLIPHQIASEAPLLVDLGLAEEVSTEAEVVTKATKRVAKKKVIRPPPPVQVDEDEEQDDDALPASWPFAAGKGSVPSYNAFFPISINSGPSPSRTRSQQGGGQGQSLEDYFPGSATAIANSFSTGKGGIATSHATSFGDPYLASLVRNGLLNFRSKNNPQESS
ncbi:hypothetical protein NQ315_015281 [Exocentrus adspersus]|uniref:Uncharacterized protein n=1 Tax=Exocentrus adspersus TaxID=1586481 RepID=A0AAV8VAQ5_9CUCU|nr:hypothetical protein NQ315_015281 [Exocentrus adspersus]